MKRRRGVGRVADRALQFPATSGRGVGDLQLGFGGASVGEQLAELDLVGRGQERERPDLVEVLPQQRAAGATSPFGSIGHERGR